MNSYEEKIARRKERLEERADRLRAEGNSAYNRAHQMAQAIPFGQPILVGHHSEKRDRNYRGKIHNTFGKAFETLKAADEVAARAASVGTGGISSDDPEAVQKLEAELGELEAKQEAMKAANKIIRKHKTASQAAIDELGKLGIGPATATDLFVPQWGNGRGPIGFPPYRLQNNGANIRRIQSRIEFLKKNANRETKEVLHNSGVRLVENAEENRVQLFFPGKPDAEVRAKLKSSGFRWAPSAGAWQRQLNNRAVWIAKSILEELNKEVTKNERTDPGAI